MYAINDTKTLVDVIRASDDETAENLIKQYAHIRVERAIDRTWSWCRRYVNRALLHKERRIQKHLIEYDAEIGAITVRSFVKYIVALEIELKQQMNEGSWETRKFAENLHDLMMNKIGDIPIDRRTIFANED